MNGNDNDPIRKESMLSEEQELQKLEQRKKVDAKSVFIQNVDYKSTKQEIQSIFQDCGPITRITIIKDKFTSKPKGCVYISFQDQLSVHNALYLTGTKLRDRTIKVHKKRTNIAGLSKPHFQADPKLNVMAGFVKSMYASQRLNGWKTK